MSFCVNLFDNKLLICGLLLLWTVVSSSVFCAIMIQDGSNFLMIGPNERNQLFGVKMDTWFKWWVTAIYTFVSTAIAARAVSPTGLRTRENRGGRAPLSL
jgi:hypothetical protein